MTKTNDRWAEVGDGYLVWVPLVEDARPPLELLGVYAAAPDLLAAAKEFVGYCDNCGGKGSPGLGIVCSWCGPTRAAIAKAEGTA